MDNNENPLLAISQENSKLYKHNKILAKQVAIAVEGFKVLIETCADFPKNIAQKTLEEIMSCENEELE